MSLPVLPDTVLMEFLADDVRLGDLTTHVLGIGPKPARMTFAARDPMVVAGAEEAVRILEMAGATVEQHTSSGARLRRRRGHLDGHRIGGRVASRLEGGADADRDHVRDRDCGAADR